MSAAAPAGAHGIEQAPLDSPISQSRLVTFAAWPA
jgi:hypothetical protein